MSRSSLTTKQPVNHDTSGTQLLGDSDSDLEEFSDISSDESYYNYDIDLVASATDDDHDDDAFDIHSECDGEYDDDNHTSASIGTAINNTSAKRKGRPANEQSESYARAGRTGNSQYEYECKIEYECKTEVGGIDIDGEPLALNYGPTPTDHGADEQDIPTSTSSNGGIRSNKKRKLTWNLVESSVGVTGGRYIPIWCPSYSRRPGLNFPANMGNHSKKPVEYFNLLFPEYAFELIVEETNRYAAQYLQKYSDLHGELPLNSRFRNWTNCNVNEIKAYVGLQIFMGVCRKPSLKDYWSSEGVEQTPGFGKVMSRNAFQRICSFVHFNDNSTSIRKGEDGYDPLHKVRPLLDLLKPLGKKYFIPGREISIDESMKRIHGLVSLRQHLPNKPNRWGIKIWSLCDSKTGYLLDWNVYTGEENSPVGFGLGHNVVKKLLGDQFINAGHHLFVDKFYSSPNLFEYLQQHNTGACGPVKINIRGLPAGLKTADMSKGEDPIYFLKGDLIACGWHDTARVNFLSTIDATGGGEKQVRSKNSETGFRTVKKPNVALHYNEFMGGVDLFDQKCASYVYPHKCQKWYQALFHFIKEAALVNAYILFQTDNPKSKLSSADFRRRVAESLVGALPKKRANPNGRLSIDSHTNETRFTGRHFPIAYEDPKYRPNCVVCSESAAHPKRRQTHFGCEQCINTRGKYVALCVPTCFKQYHTVRKYR